MPFGQQLSVFSMLPQLRGEWVRKGVGRRGMGRTRVGKNWQASVKFLQTVIRELTDEYAVRDRPVWGINTPKAAPIG